MFKNINDLLLHPMIKPEHAGFHLNTEYTDFQMYRV